MADNTLVIDEPHRYNIGTYCSYYEDTTATMGLEAVRQQIFSPSKQVAPSFGFTSSVFWFKLKVRVDTSMMQKQWYLDIAYPMLNHIDLYGYDSAGVLLFHKKSGLFEPFANREIQQHNFSFLLPLQAQQPMELYLRVESMGAMQVPMQILRDVDLIQTQHSRLLFIGIYYGFFIIIFMYNATLYFFTYDRNYLRYLLFLSAYILWQLTYDGLGVQYFWTDAWWYIEHGTGFSILFASSAAAYFGRNFLQTRYYAKMLDKFLLILIIFSLVGALLSAFISYAIMVQVGALLSIFVPIILLYSGIRVWLKGNRAARFYILGWSAFLIGCVLFSLNKFNVIGGFYMMNYSQQIGSALEMLFLSWALADRINLLHVEYNGKLQKLNTTLQEKVQDALARMRQKDQMLAHQARLASIGETIEQIAHQWRQPLNNLALLNQDSYIKRKLGKQTEEEFDSTHDRINENLQFMSRTIDDFRNFFNVQDDVLTCKLHEIIDDALKLSESSIRYAKIAVEVSGASSRKLKVRKNEMTQVIMNLIKNSTDAINERGIQDGKIWIEIASVDHLDVLRVEDNAGGIDEALLKRIFEPYVTTKKATGGTGIGLYLSRLIIEKYEGVVHVRNTDKGVRFTITLPVTNSGRVD